MQFEEAFEANNITEQNAHMYKDDFNRLQEWLRSLLPEDSQEEGEETQVSVETAVSLAALSFVAGITYERAESGDDAQTISVEMTPEQVGSYIDYLRAMTESGE